MENEAVKEADEIHHLYPQIGFPIYHPPCHDTQGGEVHFLCSILWDLGLVACTLLLSIDYPPPYIFLLCFTALNYDHSPTLN